ncbi:MAG: Hint domain-containing protein [Roseovarius sp.]|nr:Hint domain-containing protein [Roseovarius sp.]
MAIGYLVSLGNNSLDSGDAISATQSTFNIDSTLGTGKWTWSGIWSNDGNFYSNVTDTGTYFLGDDGNVYFTPDTWFTDSGTASVVSAPSYTDTTDGVVDGTAGDDLIDTEFTDAQGDGVDSDSPASKNDSIEAGDGQDTVIAGDGDDTVRGGTGDDLIFGDGGDGGTFAGTIGNFTLSAANISESGAGTGGPVGQFATYDSVATTDTGTVVQMRVTVIDVEDPNMIVDLADTIGLNSDSAVAAGTGVTFRFEFFDQATGEPIQIDGALTFRDIDTVAESVSASSSDVTGLALSGNPATNLTATATADTLTASSDGTSSGFADENHWAQFLFEGQSSMDFTMTSRAAFTAYDFGSFQFANTSVITASTPITMNDLLDGGEGADTIFGEAGDDTILGGDGNDLLSGGIGNNSLAGGAGDDTFVAGDGADTFSGDSGLDIIDYSASGSGVSVDLSTNTLSGGAAANDVIAGGIDGIIGSDFNDTLTGFDGSGADYTNVLDGGAGDDLIDGRDSGDSLMGGDGSDTILGGGGDDTILGQGGDDSIILADGFGNDVITGGETGETLGDTLDLSALTGPTTVDLTSADPEAGNVSDGTSTATFTEIENIVLGSGINTIVLADGSGNDAVTGFAAPTDNGDSTFTGRDQLDVSGLQDLNGNPVNTVDTVVTSDADGNAVLTFPGGESLTLIGVSPASISDPAALAAMGVPLAGPVDGTAGADLINTAYLGDPEGDRIDGNDAPDGSNDDTVLAGDGNDSIDSGLGNDLVFAGSGDDEIFLDAVLQNDTIYGGEGGETAGEGDRINFSAISTPLTINFTAPEAGTITDGTSVTKFFEIERFQMGTGSDTVIGSDGVEEIIGNFGNDSIIAGGGNDTVFSGFDDDYVEGGAGDDSLVASSGADTIDGGTGNDQIDLGPGDGEVDVLVLQDGSGVDVVSSFEAPVDNGDGTFTGRDQFDVAGLTDASGNPVTTEDVTVSEDAGGNAVLTFPGGESVTLVGVPIADVQNPDQLVAMGIPPSVGNFIVEGTAGGDLIDAAYLGDPQGDRIDNNDAADGGNDDVVFAGFGDDTILGGDGADEIHGEDGNDSAEGGIGDDTLFGAGGNDTLSGGDGNDSMEGFTGSDLLIGGAGDDYLDGGTEADTLFGGDGNDTLLAGSDVADDSLDGGAGNDSLSAGGGNDTLLGGTGDDLVFAAEGDDLIVMADDFGNDTIDGWTNGAGGDTLDAGAVTQDTVLDLTAGDPGNPEQGTLSNGTQTAQFSEIETVILGSGNDQVIGSGGDDSVSTGAGADTVDGGAGDDSFDVGAGDGAVDTVVFGDTDGSDTITGFEAPIDNGDGTFTGQDQLDVSGLTDADGNPVNVADVTVTDDGSGNAVLSFPNGESITLLGIAPADVTDHDALAAMGIAQTDYIVEGTAGDDLIDADYTGDPDGDLVDNLDSRTNGNDDTILAGDGNDTVLVGLGDDSVRAGAGDDSVSGGDGNDSIFGDEDNDTLFGGTGDDLLDGGTGDDVLLGEDGSDTLLGGDGNDLLTGGIGADSIVGGSGADTIEVAQGDIAEGGDGDDTFILSDLGEAGSGAITIIGGEGGETAGDTLFLTPEIGRDDITFTNTDDAAGGLSGTFEFNGAVVNFSEIENIICFTPGARILTQFGERAIETLQLGDMVVTRDHGLQPIRWIGQRTVPGIGDFAPISVASSVMEGAREGLLVSPQHRILFTGYRAELLFGESEVLVAAKHLINARDVRVCPRDEVTYIHIMFDRHEVIYAEGIATESFHAGDTALTAITAPAREELFAIFPELRSAPGRHRDTARTCLKRHEAQLLRGDTSEDWMA